MARTQTTYSSPNSADCPPQIETVVKSVNKTGRCIVVHEAVKTGGVGSELAAEIQERCFLRLESPVQRITGWDTPFGLAYEKFYLPDQLRIVSRLCLFAVRSGCRLTLALLLRSTPSLKLCDTDWIDLDVT